MKLECRKMKIDNFITFLNIKFQGPYHFSEYGLEAPSKSLLTARISLKAF
jgi:hypothetical protein